MNFTPSHVSKISMKIMLAWAALALILAAFAPSANAGEKLTVETLFNDVTTTAPKCFGKEYSRAHMAARPKQTVEQIRVKLVKYSADKSTPSAGLRIEARLKGESGLNYVADMSCMDSKSRVMCVIECDGGSVTITQASATSLTVKNNGFIVTGGCGEEGPDGEPSGVTKFLEAIKGGNDTFALEALPKSYCADSDTTVFTE